MAASTDLENTYLVLTGTDGRCLYTLFRAKRLYAILFMSMGPDCQGPQASARPPSHILTQAASEQGAAHPGVLCSEVCKPWVERRHHGGLMHRASILS